MRTFELFTEDAHWWSRNDYGAVVDAMARLKAAGQPIARVLEFGPGSSTLALIEGGATHIATLEDDPDWAVVHEERLVARFPDIVHLHRYTWSEPLSIPSVDGERYDFALIDGPRGSDRRPAAVRYALDRCTAVLSPTEDGNPALRRALVAMAAELGLHIDIRETGPLSGGFALLTRPGPALPRGSEQVLADMARVKGPSRDARRKRGGA